MSQDSSDSLTSGPLAEPSLRHVHPRSGHAPPPSGHPSIGATRAEADHGHPGVVVAVTLDADPRCGGVEVGDLLGGERNLRTREVALQCSPAWGLGKPGSGCAFDPAAVGTPGCVRSRSLSPPKVHTAPGQPASRPAVAPLRGACDPTGAGVHLRLPGGAERRLVADQPAPSGGEVTLTMESLFGAPISVYTRAHAIEDGVLVDVTTDANQAGIALPCALTAGAWAEAVAWNADNRRLQDEPGRLWDALVNARRALCNPIASGDGGPIVFGVLRVPNTPKATRPRLFALVADVGPGDDGAPVVTILLEGED